MADEPNPSQPRPAPQQPPGPTAGLAVRGNTMPDLLRPGEMIAPGTAPTPSAVQPVRYLVGQFAEISFDISGTPTRLYACTQWKVRMQTEYVDISGHGDYYKLWEPISVEWGVEATGYLNALSVDSYARAFYEASGAYHTAPIFTFRGWSGPTGNTSLSNPNLLFAGYVRAEDVEISAPMGLAEQTIRLKGYGTPLAGILGL